MSAETIELVGGPLDGRIYEADEPAGWISFVSLPSLAEVKAQAKAVIESGTPPDPEKLLIRVIDYERTETKSARGFTIYAFRYGDC